MDTEQTPRRSFGREFLSNLGLEVGTAVIRLLLLVVPAVVGYLVGDGLGLVLGLAVGVVLLAVFWIAVVVLGAGGAGSVLRGRR
jgi:hypothetical protein